MRAQKTDDGTYCILDHRGPWFEEPQVGDGDMHTLLAISSARGWPSKLYPHHFRLGRGRSASKV